MPLYREPSLWSDALRRHFIFSPDYFRPLGVLSFISEISLLGFDSRFFHLINLLIHAFNAALVTLIAYRLWMHKDCSIAAVAGLLYGLHPVLIEGVAFISSRFDLLLTSTLLLALLADGTFRNRWSRAALVGGAYFLGALTKEMAAAFILVLPMWHIICEHRRDIVWWKILCRRENWAVYGAVVVTTILVILMRRMSLGYLLFPGARLSINAGSFLQHILLIARSLIEFVTIILWPFTTLTPIHYATLPFSVSEPRNWLAVGSASGIILSLLWGFWRRSRPATLALAGVLSLLPVLNLRPLQLGGGAFIAERFLVFPLALFILSSIDAIDSLFPRRFYRWIWMVWLTACIAVVQLTLPHWRDDEALWTWGSERAPLSEIPPVNLALQAAYQGHLEQALNYAQRAISLKPDHGNAWNTMGFALHLLRRYPEAQSHFEQATKLEPHVALYWSNLAGALREQGKFAQAEKILLEQTLRIDPNLPMGHLNLGILYFRGSRPDLAAQPLQMALRLLPPNQKGEAQEFLDKLQQPGPWFNFATKLLAQGDIVGTLRATDQAQVLGGSSLEVALLRSSVLIEQHELDQAESLLLAALQTRPNDARLVNNLGIVARERGDSNKARELFRKAAELAPKWELPRQNLSRME
jgi:Flp pilus assembly protein TadD